MGGVWLPSRSAVPVQHNPHHPCSDGIPGAASPWEVNGRAPCRAQPQTPRKPSQQGPSHPNSPCSATSLLPLSPKASGGSMALSWLLGIAGRWLPAGASGEQREGAPHLGLFTRRPRNCPTTAQPARACTPRPLRRRDVRQCVSGGGCVAGGESSPLFRMSQAISWKLKKSKGKRPIFCPAETEHFFHPRHHALESTGLASHIETDSPRPIVTSDQAKYPFCCPLFRALPSLSPLGTRPSSQAHYLTTGFQVA
jgi:hypothetical protein